MDITVILLIGFIIFSLYMIGLKAKKNKEEKLIAEGKAVAKPDIFIRITQGRGLQLLETIDIISNTKNIDTLRGRIIFVKKIYPSLIYAAQKKRFLTDMQSALDQYKNMYYDKMLQEYQVALLITPKVDNLDVFLGNAIANTFERYVAQQQIEINKLKRESAIKKRHENIIKIGYDAKRIFKEFRISDYNNNLTRIENVRKQYYNYPTQK